MDYWDFSKLMNPSYYTTINFFMKKAFLYSLFFLLTVSVMAKKVRFSVDMTDQLISPTGVHIAGDFQALAGYPGGDWQPNTTEMENEPGTDFYSVIVEIPAHQKYEYKFINGSEWYEVEFVPEYSRVGYLFNDNRWFYLDSLANDTTHIGPIFFGGNAPAGQYLVRFRVNMKFQPSIDPEGVHVAGNFQEWNPASCRMFSFDGETYEYIAYSEINISNIDFRYINGENLSQYENVPAECCDNSGNRNILVQEDLVLEPVCFSECVICDLVGIPESIIHKEIGIFPNPSSGITTIQFDDEKAVGEVIILDQFFRKVITTSALDRKELMLDFSGIIAGVYTITILYKDKTVHTSKIIVN